MPLTGPEAKDGMSGPFYQGGMRPMSLHGGGCAPGHDWRHHIRDRRHPCASSL